MKHVQWLLKTEIGPLYLVAGEKGLRGIHFKKQSVPTAKSLNDPGPQTCNLKRAAAELEEYFAGKRKKFGVALDLEGTPFQKSVWKALAEIPYGQTRSYRQIASRIKKGKAVRAVGSANGCNPVCVVIPCHRVIAADGTIGGYSGGTGVKKKLLKLEKASWI
jgi:methylated-DNA-[protein]-cysteine S-methyltransferase